MPTSRGDGRCAGEHGCVACIFLAEAGLLVPIQQVTADVASGQAVDLTPHAGVPDLGEGDAKEVMEVIDGT